MAKIPFLARVAKNIEQDIHDALAQERASEKSRGLRLSSIGHCPRKQWFSLHAVPEERPPHGRTLRIFEMGHTMEAMIVSQLRRAGYTVREADENGDQFEVRLPDGTIGHTDGLIKIGNEWRLLEIKTAKAARFDELEEARSYKAWSEEYYAQIQAYMGGLWEDIDFVVEDSLVIVDCKDDSRMWCEKIRFDQSYFDMLVERLKTIRSNELPPPRPDKVTQYGKYCKWCSFNRHCYGPMAEWEPEA